jgi:hypothetical protein
MQRRPNADGLSPRAANPLISSALAFDRIGRGLTTVKPVTVSVGTGSYLRRVHSLVALLTAGCFGAAILFWTALLLGRSPRSFVPRRRTILDEYVPHPRHRPETSTMMRRDPFGHLLSEADTFRQRESVFAQGTTSPGVARDDLPFALGVGLGVSR